MASNAYGDILKMINKTQKPKTLSDEFIDDLSRYFQISAKSHPPSMTIKPSSLGGCYRMQYCILQGIEKDAGKLQKADMITIQQSGNDRHIRLQNAMMDMTNYQFDLQWVDISEEVKKAQSIGINTIVRKTDGNETLCYNEDYNTSFKCDGIIIFRGKKMILEIKTDEYFNFQKRYGPNPAHEFQAMLYSLCFGINYILFLYEDRNLTLKKSYIVEVTDKQRKIVRERIQHISTYNQLKIVPPKEKDKCTYCDYKTTCKKYGDTPEYTLDSLKELLNG